MQAIRHALKTLAQAVQISRAPFVALGIAGAFWGTLAGMVPELKFQLDASDAELGTSMIGGAIGGAIAMFFAPRVFAALGKFALPALAAVVVLTLQLPIFAHSAAAFFPILLVMSVSLAGLDVCANIRLSQLEERHGAHLMNVNHAMYSLVFGSAALLVAALRQMGWGVAEIFPFMGGLIALASVLLWEKNWTIFKPNASEDEAPKRLPWVLIAMTSVMLFSAFIGENATETWSAIFIERELGGVHGTGSFGPAMLGFVMCAARLGGHVTVTKIGEERLLIGSGVLAALGALILASAPTQAIALCAISIIAVGVASVVPTATALLGKSVHGSQRALAISQSWMWGMSGFFVGPAMMGASAQAWGLRASFVLVAVLVTAIIPAVLIVRRQKAKS